MKTLQFVFGLAAVALSASASAADQARTETPVETPAAAARPRLGFPFMRRDSSPAEPTPSPTPATSAAMGVPVTTTLSWWSVPRRARTAARAYATAQRAGVTRYARVVEPDGSAHFDVYAAHRAGLKARDEFLLVSVPDPEARSKRSSSP